MLFGAFVLSNLSVRFSLPASTSTCCILDVVFLRRQVFLLHRFHRRSFVKSIDRNWVPLFKNYLRSFGIPWMCGYSWRNIPRRISPMLRIMLSTKRFSPWSSADINWSTRTGQIASRRRGDSLIALHPSRIDVVLAFQILADVAKSNIDILETIQLLAERNHTVLQRNLNWIRSF